jgi:ribonuclease HII
MKPKRIIIGIDEVGRGALAGPVVASAIAIEHLIDGVKDSKLLNVKQREKLAGEIENTQSLYQLK